MTAGHFLPRIPTRRSEDRRSSGYGAPPLRTGWPTGPSICRSGRIILPEPQASLVQGIVLGMRDNIPTSLRTDFAQSGTTHLLAISGLHLSIVTGILLATGRWIFGRRYNIYIWLALVAIWFYAVITGMNPPVMRAAIMASLFLAADLLGRQLSVITPLTFAGAIMVGIDPQVLWNASFQLSFLAMVGLIFVAPWLQAQGRKAIATTLGERNVAASTQAKLVIPSVLLWA